MFLIRDLYGVLRISPDAAPADIDTAFHVAMEEAAALNQCRTALARLCGRDADGLRFAHRELIDPARRARHDAEWNRYPPMLPPL